eukprot:TRINITY_DN4835_c1_g1_i2.p1 TRINITY_DN4835_c1_g1~~TRINITY_DN4835_c1_g1_i2.p1  ORF type:complete len:920 (-),score=367.49 TRINITY_DN4835_c1_g1_i2:144-2903(-)
MHGKTVLWVPGIDHAGIATQDIVEKKLIRTEGKNRHDYGREAFISKVWEWKEEYGGRIKGQLKRIGSSLDWEHEVFTLDEKLSKSVTEAFVRMWESGLIYRDVKLINWCCKLNTAISNIEVDKKPFPKPKEIKVPNHDTNKTYEFGRIDHFYYEIDGEEDIKLEIATTRIETMLGDTAVAVHSKDEKHKPYHGKFVKHPFIEGRKIPIIVDDILVKVDKGTGCVKVTPAHDQNDYECGKRHDLEMITIFTDDGKMNDKCPEPFRGMMRFDCRIAIIEELKKKNLFKESKPNNMVIGICSRTGDIVEPMIKPQWFVKCKGMAERAAEAVNSGELKIYPDHPHKKIWLDWCGDLHDWCISRQLWWGHRIPAYMVKTNGKMHEPETWVCGRNEEEAMENARKELKKQDAEVTDEVLDSITLEQDPDVLDTWFSSGLFPFSVFGWPNETEDLKRFFPTSLLETGSDILFFWVLRMVMMSLELNDCLPFTDIYFHSMVRDAFGKKMSKSKGNVVDPIDVIEGITLDELHKKLYNSNLPQAEIDNAIEGQKKNFPTGIGECGTDAMRFALCNYTGVGADINLKVSDVENYRCFCNKLWQAARFFKLKVGDDFSPLSLSDLQEDQFQSGNESLAEKWILSRLQQTIEEVENGFSEYNFTHPTNALWKFTLNDLCDTFIECSRPFINIQDNSNPEKVSYSNTLYTCINSVLRLLHPFMPFITEELYHRLPKRQEHNHLESIKQNQYPPFAPQLRDEALETNFDFIKEISSNIRFLRSVYHLKSRVTPEIFLVVSNEETQNQISPFLNYIISLTNCQDPITILIDNESNKETIPSGCATKIVNHLCEIHMEIAKYIDIPSEITRLSSSLSKKQKTLNQLLKRISSYNPKVPQRIRDKDAQTKQQLEVELQKMQSSIDNFNKLLASSNK